jgi:hypothetical protein
VGQDASCGRQGRMAPRRALSPNRLNRHQPQASRRARRGVLQSARHAEQWIKEGKTTIKWTRLSCRRFRHNAVRLQLHALAYNLANFMRTLALPKDVEHWSLTTIREKLVKIGAEVVAHGCDVTFQMVEVAVSGGRKILNLIDGLRRPSMAAGLTEETPG